MSNLISDGMETVIVGTGVGAFNQDAFARYRTSQPYMLYEFNSNQGILTSTLFNNFGTTLVAGGTVTHNNTRKTYAVATSTGATDSAIFQTRRYFRYQAGKSRFIVQSYTLGTGATNTRKRIGYFDANDGVFLEQNGTALSLTLRSSVSGSPVDTTVAQASWNGDPLNGTGLSGKTLNPAFNWIQQVDLQWLGAGRVKVSFVIDDQEIVAHTFYNANLISGPYMTSGSLPLRYEVTNTGASTGSSLNVICGMVASEGGATLEDSSGNSWTAQNANAGVALTTTEIAVIAIRPKTTFLSNTFRGTIIPASTSVLCDTRDLVVAAYYNPTITGGTWTSVNANSAVEVNTTMTAFSGGRKIISQFQDTSSAIDLNPGILSKENLTLDLAGTTQDIYLVTARSVNLSGTVFGAINWKEFMR